MAWKLLQFWSLESFLLGKSLTSWAWWRVSIALKIGLRWQFGCARFSFSFFESEVSHVHIERYYTYRSWQSLNFPHHSMELTPSYLRLFACFQWEWVDCKRWSRIEEGYLNSPLPALETTCNQTDERWCHPRKFPSLCYWNMGEFIIRGCVLHHQSWDQRIFKVWFVGRSKTDILSLNCKVSS